MKTKLQLLAIIAAIVAVGIAGEIYGRTGVIVAAVLLIIVPITIMVIRTIARRRGEHDEEEEAEAGHGDAHDPTHNTLWQRVVNLVCAILGLAIVLACIWWGAKVLLHWSTPTRPGGARATAPERVKTLYRFPRGGCVRVKVHPGEVDFYPQGGEVLITPPRPAQSFRDKPGGPIEEMGELPPGEYKICRVDRDAWGVAVLN